MATAVSRLMMKPDPLPSMPPADVAETAVIGPWSLYVIRPLLISLQVTAVAAVALVFLRQVLPIHPWPAHLPLYFIVAVETYFTTVWLARPNQRQIHNFAYRSSEFLILLLLNTLLIFLLTAELPSLEDWTLYLRAPQRILLDNLAFTVTTTILMLVWVRAIDLTDIFNQLTLSPGEIAYYQLPAGERRRLAANRPIQANRQQILNRFFQKWMGGAFFIVLLAAITSIDVTEVHVDNLNPLNLTQLGLHREVLIALLFYFGAGFLLLSQGRLAALQARWLVNDIQQEPTVERSWHRYGLLILLVIAFVAAFLPIGSTIAVGKLFEIFIFFIFALALITLYLLSLLLYAFLFLFGRSETSEPPPPPNLQEALPPPPEAAAQTDLLGMIIGSLFWALAIVGAIVAVSFYLRERGYSSSTIKSDRWRRLWRAFVAWLRSLWRGFSTQVQSAGLNLRDRVAKRPEREGKRQFPWRFVRVNALSPRDQVRYFYLSTVRRAGEKGVSRKEGETPLEYNEDLGENWPRAKENLDRLTRAFLQARYNREPITEEEAERAKGVWKETRRVLRRDTAVSQKKPEEKNESDAPSPSD